MKTIKRVIEERPEYKILINAVLSRIGKDSVEDVINNGADVGFNGFIYYVDTHKFAMRYRKHIVKMLNEMASELGENVVEMVSNFGVFKRNEMDSEDERDLYKYLGGGRPQQGAITNVMAWFALEEVCRMFED